MLNSHHLYHSCCKNSFLLTTKAFLKLSWSALSSCLNVSSSNAVRLSFSWRIGVGASQLYVSRNIPWAVTSLWINWWTIWNQLDQNTFTHVFQYKFSGAKTTMYFIFYFIVTFILKNSFQKNDHYYKYNEYLCYRCNIVYNDDFALQIQEKWVTTEDSRCMFHFLSGHKKRYELTIIIKTFKLTCLLCICLFADFKIETPPCFTRTCPHLICLHSVTSFSSNSGEVPMSSM